MLNWKSSCVTSYKRAKQVSTARSKEPRWAQIWCFSTTLEPYFHHIIPFLMLFLPRMSIREVPTTAKKSGAHINVVFTVFLRKIFFRDNYGQNAPLVFCSSLKMRKNGEKMGGIGWKMKALWFFEECEVDSVTLPYSFEKSRATAYGRVNASPRVGSAFVIITHDNDTERGHRAPNIIHKAVQWKMIKASSRPMAVHSS